MRPGPAEDRMLFNDYPFLLVFLPASLAIYRLADPHPHARMAVLVLLSLVFYAYPQSAACGAAGGLDRLQLAGGAGLWPFQAADRS